MTIQRTIQFYSIRSDEVDGQRPPMPLAAAIASIPRTYDITSSDTNVLVEGNGNLLSVHVDSEYTHGRLRLRLARTRLHAIPQAHRNGAIRDLELLDGEGVFEPAHIVLFANENCPGTWVAGIEYNQAGPHPTALRTYLAVKCPDLPPFKQLHCIDQEIEERFNQMALLRMVTIRLERADKEILEAECPELTRSLFTLVEDLDGAEVEVSVRVRNRKEALAHGALEYVRRLLHGARPTKLLVRGLSSETGRSEELNLLQQWIGQKVTVDVNEENSHVIISSTLYDQIEQHFDRNRANVLTASAV